MTGRLAKSGIVCIVALAVSRLVAPAVGTAQTPTDAIRQVLESARMTGYATAGGEALQSLETVSLFYEDNRFEPIWTDAGRPKSLVDSLIVMVRSADVHGLQPSDYHSQLLGDLNARLTTGDPAADPVDLELLATDAFLTLGVHLLKGKVNPQTIDAEWHAKPRSAELREHLQQAIANNAVRQHLSELAPADPMYRQLQSARRLYLDLAVNEWETVPDGPALSLGDRGPRVAALERRLRATGDMDNRGDITGDFDEGLDLAVRHFQRRHGLNADGVVGTKSLAALNVSANVRAEQIARNLERWRWLPERLARRHITVNIAGPELALVYDYTTVLEMRVIVGKPYRQTPVFSDRITYLVLNPYWNVPPKLGVQDVLPQVRKNPDYLAQQGIRVISGYGADMSPVDASTIDWSRMTASNFRYWFRQDPGPLNSLGRIKFMFPNPYNVYLHDTPKRELFAREGRDFSSGCIRLEKPIELAEVLLGTNPEWTHESLLKLLDVSKDRTVQLPEPIEVHLLYWTAWVDDDGTVNFRSDIYSRDSVLAAALREAPPTISTKDL